MPDSLLDGAYRFSVAPMMDHTDRHFRFFMRLLTRRTLLYTEMITTGAILQGDRERHLDFSPVERPLALLVDNKRTGSANHYARALNNASPIPTGMYGVIGPEKIKAE